MCMFLTDDSVIITVDSPFFKYVTRHEIFGPMTSSGHKIIKLRLETRLKSQASDWLKWRPAN